MIRIVNLKNYKKVPGEILIKIDRSSAIGNPFYMSDESLRDKVCDDYQDYFDGILGIYLNTDNKLSDHDLEFVIELNDIIKLSKTNNIALGCWCAPKRCHGETIKRYIDALVEPEKEIVKEFRVVVAGGRDFYDYKVLKAHLDHLLSLRVADGYKIVIISGKARGADSLGEVYAKEKGYEVHEKAANWDLNGRSAGHIRNKEMLDYAMEKGCVGACIMFWNGLSKGTKGMYDLCIKYGLINRVIRY